LSTHDEGRNAEDGEFYTTLDVQTITEMVPVQVRPPGKKKR
jgi:hypothetical protein